MENLFLTSTPEELGIKSEWMINFLDRLNKQELPYCVRNATLAENRQYSGRNRMADGCIPLALTPPSISGYTVLPSHKCLAGSI